MTCLAENAARNLENIRKNRPLIHTITNPVVMNFSANALLAMGAVPVMAYAPQEVEDMVAHAAALVLNTGTLTSESKKSMMKAGKKAQSLGLPVVLDPVGSGATAFRTHTARQIVDEIHPRVIRGNPTEIMSLTGTPNRSKGVYSVHRVEDAAESGKTLARQFETTVAITGTIDMITDGTRAVRTSNGHPFMGLVTGTGCTASAIIGAFLTAGNDPLRATATALAFLGLAGDTAGKKATAPGAFMIEMINALYTLEPQDLANGCRFEEE